MLWKTLYIRTYIISIQPERNKISIQYALHSANLIFIIILLFVRFVHLLLDAKRPLQITLAVRMFACSYIHMLECNSLWACTLCLFVFTSISLFLVQGSIGFIVQAAALEWFKRAAASGHPEAAYNLAVGHLKGHELGLEVMNNDAVVDFRQKKSK